MKATAIAALACGGLMMLEPSAATAAGWGHRYDDWRYGTPVRGVVPAPYRYLRCRGGRIYTALGGWGCDYYYARYYLPRRH